MVINPYILLPKSRILSASKIMEILEDKKPMALYQFALQAPKMNRFAAYIVIGGMVVVSFYSCLHSFVHFLVLTFFPVCAFAEGYGLSWLPATGVKMMANLNSFVFCYPLVSTVKFPTAFYSSVRCVEFFRSP